jgi:hypothetical protein
VGLGLIFHCRFDVDWRGSYFKELTNDHGDLGIKNLHGKPGASDSHL